MDSGRGEIMNFFLTQILLPFVISLLASAIVVIFGIRSLRDYIDDRVLQEQYGQLKEFWWSEGAGKRYVLIAGSEAGDEHSFEVEPRIGYSQSHSLTEVTHVIEAVHNSQASIESLLLARDGVIPSEIFINANVIIFGGELVLEKFRQLSLDLEVPFYQHNLDLQQRNLTRLGHGRVIEELQSHVDFASRRILSDFGTATRILNPSNGKLIFLFNANYSVGLLASVLATTQPGNFPSGSFNKSTLAQQLVVEVSNPDRNNLISKQHPIIPRNWITFTITGDQIREAIERASH